MGIIARNLQSIALQPAMIIVSFSRRIRLICNRAIRTFTKTELKRRDRISASYPPFLFTYPKRIAHDGDQQCFLYPCIPSQGFLRSYGHCSAQYCALLIPYRSQPTPGIGISVFHSYLISVSDNFPSLHSLSRFHKAAISSFLSYQFRMLSLLDQLPSIYYQNLIRVFYGRKPVSNNNHSFAHGQFTDCL